MLTNRCVEVLDLTAAGLVLAAPREGLRVVAASSDATHVLGLFELQSDEGPCLDCFRTGQPVVNHDLTTADSPWPQFATAAVEAGFRSVHALPMRLRGFVIGVLNLLHTDPGTMQQADVDAAQALADVATIAIIQYRTTLDANVLTAQLNHALNSRVVIEQAKGIVAERKGVGMDQAFALLRTHARSHNRRLADVARDLIGGHLSAAALNRSHPKRPPRPPKP